VIITAVNIKSHAESSRFAFLRQYMT